MQIIERLTQGCIYKMPKQQMACMQKKAKGVELCQGRALTQRALELATFAGYHLKVRGAYSLKNIYKLGAYAVK